MTKRSISPKDIGLLKQMNEDGQLLVAGEFQRNSVWPRVAKAYLIDTILTDRPIPLLFFLRSTSAQSGRATYTVIDGQQRLRAIFEYIDDEYALTKSDRSKSYYRKKFSDLSRANRDQILNYDLNIEELVGYSDKDIRDMFVRMNKYVVKLSPQELRHAKEEGAFATFVDELGDWDYWGDNRVFTMQQIRRFRAVELAAEFVILLVEGPQDKKSSIDLYYAQYREEVPFDDDVENLLWEYLCWIEEAVNDLTVSRFRKPTDLYALIGALNIVSRTGTLLRRMKPLRATSALSVFEAKTRQTEAKGEIARYVVAASRQTDNVIPRRTRIQILGELLQDCCL